MTGMARIGERERILNLDVLRGVAILGILFMNIQYMGDFANPDYFPRHVSWTGWDRTAWWINRMLDGTQRGLLELLFGAGVLIMTRAAMTPDGPVAVADLHLRRNLWLMAFGIAHGVILLWPGDILFSYGTAALLVFGFRTLRPRQLLIIGVAIGAVLAAPSIPEYTERVALVEAVAAADARAAGGNPATAADTAARKDWAKVQAELAAPDPMLLAADRARVLGTFADYAGYQRELWVAVQFTEIGIYFENVVEAFGTMLIGMALFKWGIVQGAASRRTYWRLLAAGYGIGFALRIPATIAEMRFDGLPDIGVVTAYAARLPMTLGHLAALNLALGTAAGRRLLAPFVATGRMPLTTYMGASLAAILLFGGPFFGLWGSLGFGALFLIAVGIIAVQLAGANLWLRHFANGPLEWLWKSLAYNQRQPWRRGVPAGAEVTS